MKTNKSQVFFRYMTGLVLVLILCAPDAHAAAFNLGTIVCDFAQQNTGWAPFINWMAYISGTFFIVKALLALQKTTEDAGRNPLSKAMLYAMAGTAFSLFPSFMRMLVMTLHGGTWVGGGLACTPGIVTAVPGPTVGLDVLAQNFVGNIRDPFFFFAGYICYFLGGWFIYRGIHKMAKYNTDPKAYSFNAIIGNLIVGTMMLWIGRAKDMLMASIFGLPYGTCNGLSRATTGAPGACNNGFKGVIDWASLGFTGPTTQFDNAYIAATIFFQIIGFIAFIRGWLIAKTVMEGVGQGGMGQALTHIIGGAICMNIIVFLRAAQATFGVNFFI